MKLHRNLGSLAFRASPRLARHQSRDGGASRYVVFAAGFVLALLIVAVFS